VLLAAPVYRKMIETDEADRGKLYHVLKEMAKGKPPSQNGEGNGKHSNAMLENIEE
jgi:hypothetical protein